MCPSPEPLPGGDELAAVLRQVRRIELRTRRQVANLASGAYRSAFRGSGLEFDEVREYSPGDDVRHIDWNVTARAGRAYVKVFREERELALMLLVDLSGSMRFGAHPGVAARSKLALAAEAAAVVAVNAVRNRDRVGLVAFAQRTHLHLPARRGRGHALRLVREIIVAQTAPEPADLVHALDELRHVARRRSVVFLISDFLEADAAFAPALARAAGRHEIIGVRVAAPAEEQLPAVGWPLAFTNPEGAGEQVFSSGRTAVADYARLWQSSRASVAKAFSSAGCDLIDCTTVGGAAEPLYRAFQRRRSRRAR